MFQHLLVFQLLARATNLLSPPPTPPPYNSDEVLNLAMTYLTSESSFHGAAGGLWFDFFEGEERSFQCLVIVLRQNK